MKHPYLFLTVSLLFLAGANVLYGQPRVSNDLRPVYVASDEVFGRGTVIQGGLDLNRNGKGEFLIWELDDNAGYVFEATGDNTFTVLTELAKEGRFVDLNNDGQLEYVVLVGDASGEGIRIYSWDYLALKLSDTPVGTTNFIPEFGGGSGSYVVPRLITNLDQDSRWEIFTQQGFIPNSNTAFFHVVELDVADMANPRLRSQFSAAVLGEEFGNGPAVMDLDGDGYKELMLNSNKRGRSYIIRANSDSTFDNLFTFTWPLATPGVRGRFHNNPVVYDVDGDGKDDVFTGEYFGGFFYLENKGTVAATFEPSNIKYLFKLLTNPFGDMLTTGTISDVDGNGKVNFYYVSRDDTALVDIEYQGGNKADSANYTVKYYRIPKRDGYGKLGESYWELCPGFSVAEMCTMDLDADGKREIVVSTWHPNVVGTSQAGFLIFESSKPVTSVESKQAIPQRYELSQNYPNPFNPATTIRFALAKTGKATLVVTDVLGREVARLIDEVMMAGAHSIQFDTSGLTSGIYLYTLKTENFVATKRMLVLH